MTAIGVMREAYDHDIKIPDDLSVVGFDDIRLAEFTIPPLTTVQMSQHELAKIAFQALLNEVESEPRSSAHHRYELTTSLVLRRSTALAPAAKYSMLTPKGNRARRIPQNPGRGLALEWCLRFAFCKIPDGPMPFRKIPIFQKKVAIDRTWE